MLTPLFLFFGLTVVLISNLSIVDAPPSEQIIFRQAVAWVPQLDGGYKQVLVNIVALPVPHTRLGYWDAKASSIYVDFNWRKTIVNDRWKEPCNSTMWHELKHAELEEQNINIFDEHELMKIRYKCQ